MNNHLVATLLILNLMAIIFAGWCKETVDGLQSGYCASYGCCICEEKGTNK